MNIVVEKMPKCAATLRVETPADTVQLKRDEILRKYTRQARVPGFRPGKAPASVVAKRFEKQIDEELVEKLIQEAYDQALAKEDLKVLDFGIPDDVKLNESGFQFSSIMTLAPELALPEYKGIQVKVPAEEVPEEDLQDQLENLRQRFADFEGVEGRGVQSGDYVVIDYSSTIEGKPTEEFLGKPAGYLTGREGFWLKVDEQSFLPGFCAQLEGLMAGDSKEIGVTLPDDFPIEDLRGKEMVFAVKVNEVKIAILPELNDEFAARLAPGKSLEELTSIIRENMQAERKKKIEDAKMAQIVEYFNGAVEVELPDHLVMQETQSQADAMVKRGMQQGMSEEDIQSQQEDLFAAAEKQAIVNLKTNFILQEIARVESLTVSDSELVNHLGGVAAARKVAPKKFIRDMSRAGRIPSVRNSLMIGKAIDFLVTHAEVEIVAEETEVSEA